MHAVERIKIFVLAVGFILSACLSVGTNTDAHADDRDGFSRAFTEVRTGTDGNSAFVSGGVHFGQISGAAVQAPAPVERRFYEDIEPGPTPPQQRPSRLPHPYPELNQAPPALTASEIAATSQRAAASLKVPATQFVMQPDPANNEWNAIPVGLPIWLHVERPAPINTNVTEQGIAIAMTATPSAITFDMGDGKVVRCASTTRRPADAPASQHSPTCGHVYAQPGDYQITATIEWRVDWAALGHSGQLRLASDQASYRLRVNELRSVIVR